MAFPIIPPHKNIEAAFVPLMQAHLHAESALHEARQFGDGVGKSKAHASRVLIELQNAAKALGYEIVQRATPQNAEHIIAVCDRATEARGGGRMDLPDGWDA